MRPSRSSNGVSRSIPSASASASIIRAKSGIVVETRPDGHGPLAQAQPAVGDEHRRVGAVLHAQPLADRAPAQRAVEREVVRRQLLEAAAAAVARRGAGCSGRRASCGSLGLVADPRDVDDPLAQVERRLDRVGQPRAGRPADDRPVDHDLDLVLAAVAQLGRAVQADRLAVDPHPGEARGPQLVPERLVASRRRAARSAPSRRPWSPRAGGGSSRRSRRPSGCRSARRSSGSTAGPAGRTGSAGSRRSR